MAPEIDRRDDRPVYRQIADVLRARILSGELPPGARLPSERELTETYGAARGTVREAITLLRTEGHVEVEHGRGTLVRGQPIVRRRRALSRIAPERRAAGIGPFLADLEDDERTPRVELLELGPGTAPAGIAERLGLAEADRVLVRRRRYLAGDQPMQLATSYLPWGLVEGTAVCEPDPGPGGIYARLDEMGHRLTRFTEDVRARMPLPAEARSLDLPSGVPVLRIVRTAFAGDQAVEVCDMTLAADRYVLSYELSGD